ncbi:MAG TPA: RES family NAD+ phosphorylase [Ramlibacter sp.]|uniref:RES family NAD+ phosphorylase n=1 Tax=Ramlibacter sp. TaxID=1917967 RepID=UPI002ED2BA57
MSGGFTLWRIAVDAPEYTADDLTGAGAKATGGRWNRKGHAVLYTSSSAALACLETVVHSKLGSLPMNRYLVRIDLPAAAWSARTEHTAPSLPVGWDALPEGKVSLDLGDAWLSAGDSPVLVVPSVIVPEERNVLINPGHPLCRGMTARKLRKWSYDPRLFGLHS